MKKTMLSLILFFWTLSLFAAEPAKKVPAFVLGPPGINNGQAIRELADHPEQWKKVRERIGCLHYADHVLHRQNPDDAALTELVGKFRKMNLPLQLEVGVVKEWSKIGAETFAKQKPMWNRFLRCGALIDGIALDEPLTFCNLELNMENAMEYAATETAEFIALVRKDYPDWLIGDIEAFPALNADQLIQWIDLLEAKLQAKGIRGMDFFRVDTNWVHFVRDTKKGSWPELKRIEHHCRQKGIPFSLIYWGANYPELHQQNRADDVTWFVGVLQMGFDYADVGGRPDQIILQSWVDGPNTFLPETKPFSFTNTALELFERVTISRESF